MKRFFLMFALFVFAVAIQAGEKVVYKVGSESFEGYRAKAFGRSKGLVLIIHDWDGLNDYEYNRADMLAGMGYDAFAVDLYGMGNRPMRMEGRMEETAKLYEDRQRMRTLILAGLAEARKDSAQKAVVMGYCFGGAASLELARSGRARDVVGYATFHGVFRKPSDQSYTGLKTPILVAHGGADTSVSMTDIANLAAELEESETPYEIQVYSGTPHGFTVFGDPRYREVADSQSWAAFSDFLKTNLDS